MQILANALPGFRDLRAPVVAGYTWLIFAWLLVQPDLSVRPSDDVGGALYDLGQHVGHISVAIGISVAAYFVGSLSQTLSSGLRTAWTRLLQQVWYALPSGLDDAIGIAGSPEPPEAEEISQIAERTNTMLAVAPPEAWREVDIPDVDAVANRAYSEARAELALPATLLVGKEPELFAEVDRLRSEGELRLAVIPPFVGLLVLLACNASAWYLVALGPVLALLDQGVRRMNSSRQLVADAKARGLVPSQALQRFRSWADAVESKPESPPPPPWRVRMRQTRRVLDDEERWRVEQLSTIPQDDLSRDLATLNALPTEAREALRRYAEDELRYAGSDTIVGIAFPPSGMEASRALIQVLADDGLIAPRSPDSELWKLTDHGVVVARLLTAPLPADPTIRARLEALR